MYSMVISIPSYSMKSDWQDSMVNPCTMSVVGIVVSMSTVLMMITEIETSVVGTLSPQQLDYAM